MLPPSCLALLLARCRVGLLVKNCWRAHLVRPGGSKQPPPYPQISACLLWGIAKTVSHVVCPQKQGDSHCWVPTVCQALLWMPYRQNKWHLPMKSHLKRLQGLPWWRSGWESACQCRGHRFEPWSGKIPHAAEQLGLWATTTEPAPLEPVLRNKRGRDSERPAHRDEEWPPLAATRESPCTETKTQHSQK